MSKVVHFALAGFGAWGKFHAQSIAAHPQARLSAICAPSASSRAEAAALYPEATLYSDARQMIDEANFDIIDIVTPSHTHLELCLAAIAKGRHILLEKPMATTLDDCKRIHDAVIRSGVRFAIGHELRLSSQWGEIKRLIDADRIGEPQYVLVELSRKPYRQGADGWRYDPARVGSWVLEEPIHFFDLARWYLEASGHPVELYAYGNSRDPQRPQLYDNFSAMFKYANGSYAVVSQTLAAFEHHQTVKVTGSKGAIWAAWSGALDRTLEPVFSLKVFANDTLEDHPIAQASGEVFELRQEIDQCVRMVLHDSPPIASVTDGLWSAGLCFAAEESIRQQQPLLIADMLR